MKRLYPSQTGFVVDLYAIESRPDPSARQEVEVGFMSPLDARAAAALAFLEVKKAKPSDPRLVRAWSRFIMSLLNRSPRRIRWLQRKILENDALTLAKIAPVYNQTRGPNDPLTFEEYRAATAGQNAAENRAMLLRDLIDMRRSIGVLSAMVWRVMEIDRPKHGFILSDEPVMTSNGLGGDQAFAILPLGPRRLFIAANKLQIIEAFACQPTRLERAVNDAVAKQAETFAVAQSDTHRTFLEGRLGVPRLGEDGSFASRLTWKAPV